MRVIFAGGGTGGHIYPALSLIKKLEEIDSKTEVLFIGSDRGLEKKLTEKLKIPFKSLQLQGLKRSLSLSNIKTFYKFAKALPDSHHIIKDFSPHIVVGTGGYVSAPILYEATKMKIPTIIFEPNSYPGLTNKWLGKKVSKVAIVSEDAANYFPKSKVVLTGNPRSQEVYDELLAQHDNKKQDLKKKILIFGGSLGALKINQAAQEMIANHEIKDFELVFGTGRYYYEQHSDELEKLNKKTNVQIFSYIDNMVELLPSISLIVSRAGATTISEITALGVPSILIPSPNVTHNHQFYNAQSLAKDQAAILLPEDELSGEVLFHKISELINNSNQLEQMKKKSFSLGNRKAADEFIKLMKELVDKNAEK